MLLRRSRFAVCWCRTANSPSSDGSRRVREALNELAESLDRNKVSARVYIVRGAAMALAYDAERATGDIDAVILDHHGAVVDAVREIGRAHGWAGSWSLACSPTSPCRSAARRCSAIYSGDDLVVVSMTEHGLTAV
jgi:hypothetical protein